MNNTEGKSDFVPVKYPRLMKLMHNPIVWAVLAILSVLGIILTIITLFPTTKKQFSYTVESQNIISSKQFVLDDLEILYMGKKISSLQSTNIKIWNSGSEAIRNSDLATLCPLAITATETDNIYKVSIIDASNDANRFSYILEPEKSKILINFEYVNPNDFVCVQILHSSSVTYIVDTEIIGGEERSIFLYDEKQENMSLRRLFLILFVSIGGIMLLLALITSKLKNVKIAKITRIICKVMVYLFWVTIVLGIIVIK